MPPEPPFVTKYSLLEGAMDIVVRAVSYVERQAYLEGTHLEMEASYMAMCMGAMRAGYLFCGIEVGHETPCVTSLIDGGIELPVTCYFIYGVW